MLTPALYVLALFLGLSLVVGVLVAVHDGIEYLLARRARAAGGPATGNRRTGRAARSATTGGTAAAHASSGRAVRARVLVVVSTESGLAPAPSVYQARAYQARAYQDRTVRERPAWLEAAARDMANQRANDSSDRSADRTDWNGYRTDRASPAQRAARAADRRPRNRRTVQGETAAREIPTREAARLLRNSSGR